MTAGLKVAQQKYQFCSMSLYVSSPIFFADMRSFKGSDDYLRVKVLSTSVQSFEVKLLII